MLAGIRDILLAVSTPQDTPRFQSLLADGSQWGLSLSFCVQPSPDGLAQAFILSSAFVGGAPSELVLGDNIFYGHDFHGLLLRARPPQSVQSDSVRLPRERPGALWSAVEFDAEQRATSIEGEAKCSEEQLRCDGVVLLR